MARASAEASVNLCPAPPQSPLKFLADVAHSGNLDLPLVPRGHASFENWSRGELQRYLNYRIGGTNKYANYSRSKLIERLLLLETGPTRFRVSVKDKSLKEKQSKPAKPESTALQVQSLRKRSRKGKNVRRLPAPEGDDFGDRVCENAACRANLNAKEEFCRRCSCCICKLFDQNKDLSLWIECSGDKCGSSCHLECALKLGAAGVVKQRDTIQLDGSYFCVSCGFINGLLGCWVKILTVAKNARRIDVFTSRLWLAFRLFDGTSRYKDLHDMLADAVRDLDKAVGPGGLAAAAHARGLVTRVSCGASIQNRIQCAINSASSWPVEQEKQRLFVTKGGPLQRVYKIRVDEVTPYSAVASWSGAENTLGEEVAGHKLWCRATAARNFPDSPVCSIQGGGVTTALVSGLHPGVDYELRLVALTKSGEFGRVETRFSTPRVVHQLSVERGEGDASFRIREIANGYKSTGLTSVTTMTLSRGTQDSSTTVQEDLRSPIRQAANATAVEEEKHVISETKSDEKRLFCAEDMKEVLQAVDESNLQEKRRKKEKSIQSCRKVVIKRVDKKDILEKVSDQKERIYNGVFKEELGQHQNGTIVDAKVLDAWELHGKAAADTTGTEASLCKEKTILDDQSHSFIDEDQSLRVQKRKLDDRLLPEPEDNNDSLAPDDERLDKDDGWTEEYMDKSLEFSIKVIVWLERQGHLRRDFRLKLLTWLGFRASIQEKKMMFMYVRMLLTDPQSLARQLHDTFQEIVSTQRLKPQDVSS